MKAKSDPLGILASLALITAMGILMVYAGLIAQVDQFQYVEIYIGVLIVILMTIFITAIVKIERQSRRWQEEYEEAKRKLLANSTHRPHGRKLVR